MERSRKGRKTPPTHAPAAFCLLLRVYAAEGLRGVSSHGTYCKVYVGPTDMAVARKGSRQSLKHLLLSSATPDAGDALDTGAPVREFKTQVHKFSRDSPVWNEKFDVTRVDPTSDRVSLRVKSARLMSSQAVGACSLQLRDVPEDETIDRWLDLLLDGKKPAGRVRVQLRLSRADAPLPTGDADALGLTGLLRSTRRSVKRLSSSNSLSRTRLSESISPVAADHVLSPSTGVNSNDNNRSNHRKNGPPEATAGGDAGQGSETSVSSSLSSSSLSFTSRPSNERATSDTIVTTRQRAFNTVEFRDDNQHVGATGTRSLTSYDSFVLSRDRATMLSGMSSVYSRSTGSFVGSLHLYNRNSTSSSTPGARSTVIMSEAEIAALASDSTQQRRRRRPSEEDGDTESDDDDDDNEEPETEGPRIPWNSTITRMLTRKSTNIIFDEDDDGDDDDSIERPSDMLEVVPIMDFPGTPHDIDVIDCA